jgi:hypothetical protein
VGLSTLRGFHLSVIGNVAKVERLVDGKVTGIYLDNLQPMPTKHKDKMATRMTSARPLKAASFHHDSVEVF